jgi:hypothetical protein
LKKALRYKAGHDDESTDIRFGAAIMIILNKRICMAEHDIQRRFSILVECDVHILVLCGTTNAWHQTQTRHDEQGAGKKPCQWNVQIAPG